MGGTCPCTKCLRLGTCELKDMGVVLQRNSRISQPCLGASLSLVALSWRLQSVQCGRQVVGETASPVLES